MSPHLFKKEQQRMGAIHNQQAEARIIPVRQVGPDPEAAPK